MSGPSNTFHPSHREPFFDELKEVAKENGCYGHIDGLPPLPAGKSQTLNKILRNQMMMGAKTDRTGLSLELGANPNYVTNGMSQLEFARIFAKVFNDNSVVEQLESYGATNKPKKSPKKST